MTDNIDGQTTDTTQNPGAAAPGGGGDGDKTAAPKSPPSGGGEQQEMILGGDAGPLQGLSDEYRNHKALRGMGSLDDVAKSLIETQKMLGESRLKLPGEGASEEEMGKFYDALGRPPKAEDYELKVPEDLPDGIEIPDAEVQMFKDAFHAIGLTQAQAQQAFELRNTGAIEAFQNVQAQRAEAFKQGNAELDAKWKAEGHNPDTITEQTNRLIDEFGGQPVKEWLMKTGEGNNPAMRQFLGSMAMAMGEHGYVAGNSAAAAATREGAQKEIESLKSDETFQADLYGKNGDAARKAAQARWSELNELAAA